MPSGLRLDAAASAGTENTKEKTVIPLMDYIINVVSVVIFNTIFTAKLVQYASRYLRLGLALLSLEFGARLIFKSSLRFRNLTTSPLVLMRTIYSNFLPIFPVVLDCEK